MNNNIKKLYYLLLKDNWQVDSVVRKTKDKLVIIDIFLVYSPRILDAYLVPLYDTRIEYWITIS